MYYHYPAVIVIGLIESHINKIMSHIYNSSVWVRLSFIASFTVYATGLIIKLIITRICTTWFTGHELIMIIGNGPQNLVTTKLYFQSEISTLEINVHNIRFSLCLNKTCTKQCAMCFDLITGNYKTCGSANHWLFEYIPALYPWIKGTKIAFVGLYDNF